MAAEQLVLAWVEDPPLPAPLPPRATAEAIQCLADLLLQVVTDAPVKVPAGEVVDEVLR